MIAIDSDRDKVQAVKDCSDQAILGDAANKEFLDAQGVREVNAAVVSTGERSHLSTLITLYLKELKVPRSLVKAISEDHGKILEKVGAEMKADPRRPWSGRNSACIISFQGFLFQPSPAGRGFRLAGAAGRRGGLATRGWNPDRCRRRVCWRG